MSVIKFDEVKKTWYEVAKHSNDDNFHFELELHKKLLNVFHVGPYYYYIFNCATAQIEFVSPSVTDIMGFANTHDLTTDYLVNNMHPDDRPYFFDFELKVVSFLMELPPEKVMKYKMSYDYRVKSKDGEYIRILQQSVTIQSDEQGAVIRTLGVHTDITHLNKANVPTLSFIGLDGEPSYHDVSVGRVTLQPKNDPFTKREKQVLQHLLQGKSSKQIAADLFISKLTVDAHRKNLLKKTNSASTVELTLKAMQQNWGVMLWFAVINSLFKGAGLLTEAWV